MFYGRILRPDIIQRVGRAFQYISEAVTKVHGPRYHDDLSPWAQVPKTVLKIGPSDEYDGLFYGCLYKLSNFEKCKRHTYAALRIYNKLKFHKCDRNGQYFKSVSLNS